MYIAPNFPNKDVASWDADPEASHSQLWPTLPCFDRNRSVPQGNSRSWGPGIHAVCFSSEILLFCPHSGEHAIFEGLQVLKAWGPPANEVLQGLRPENLSRRVGLLYAARGASVRSLGGFADSRGAPPESSASPSPPRAARGVYHAELWRFEALTRGYVSVRGPAEIHEDPGPGDLPKSPRRDSKKCQCGKAQHENRRRSRRGPPPRTEVPRRADHVRRLREDDAEGPERPRLRPRRLGDPARGVPRAGPGRPAERTAKVGNPRGENPRDRESPSRATTGPAVRGETHPFVKPSICLGRTPGSSDSSLADWAHAKLESHCKRQTCVFGKGGDPV